MALEYNGYKLADGVDREIDRATVKRITGLTDARLSQLRDEIPALIRKHAGKAHYNLYSMRMVLEYCTSGRLNPNKKRNLKCQTRTNR